MKIFDIFRIPIIKWTGIFLVLYFGLFANTKNPQSLGNRLSKENMQKNFDEAREKSRFIAVNVKVAQEMAKEKEAQKRIAEKLGLVLETSDIDLGTGTEIISCNDEIEISYTLQTQDGKEIEAKKRQKIIIGEKKNNMIEYNILGMRKNAIRTITIPHGFQTDDKKLIEYLKFYSADLKYLITVLNIKKSPGLTIDCFRTS